MASKRMLVDAIHPEETRIVVTSGNRLEEFDFESATRRQLRGQTFAQDIIDERRLPGPAHAGDTHEHAERDLGRHVLQVVVRRADDAEFLAVRLAALTQNESALFDVELLRTWAAARGGRVEAVEELEALVERADATGTEIQRCEARLYAADAMRPTRIDVAARFCAEARAFDGLAGNVRLERLLDRVERSLMDGPIRLGVNGATIPYYLCQFGIRGTDLSGKTVRANIFRSEAGRCTEP